MESCCQDEADKGKGHEDKTRSERPKDMTPEHQINPVSEPSAGPLNIEFLVPVTQDQMLQIKQSRPTQDKNKRPPQADAESEFRGRELGDSKPHQGHRGEIGSASEEKVK